MWFLRFAVFRVQGYCFHAYILIIIVQSHFLKFHALSFCQHVKSNQNQNRNFWDLLFQS